MITRHHALGECVEVGLERTVGPELGRDRGESGFNGMTREGADRGVDALDERRLGVGPGNVTARDPSGGSQIPLDHSDR